jgi:hypothetical protein
VRDMKQTVAVGVIKATTKKAPKKWAIDYVYIFYLNNLPYNFTKA